MTTNEQRAREVRAREVLAFMDRMPPTTSRTIFYPEETALAAMLAFAQSEREAQAGWRDIKTAPYSTPVEIKCGNMTFHARLEPDAAMSGDEQPCDQWVAVNEGEHPPCWSDGLCWESNENEDASIQPDAWRPIFAENAKNPPGQTDVAGLVEIVERIAEWQRRVDDIDDDLEYLNRSGWDDLAGIADDARAALASIGKGR